MNNEIRIVRVTCPQCGAEDRQEEGQHDCRCGAVWNIGAGDPEGIRLRPRMKGGRLDSYFTLQGERDPEDIMEAVREDFDGRGIIRPEYLVITPAGCGRLTRVIPETYR